MDFSRNTSFLWGTSTGFPSQRATNVEVDIHLDASLYRLLAYIRIAGDLKLRKPRAAYIFKSSCHFGFSHSYYFDINIIVLLVTLFTNIWILESFEQKGHTFDQGIKGFSNL